jgi:hypothetical protein
MLPPGQMLPEDNVTGTEAGFMEAHGLQKLGEVDLGRFEAHFDEKSGETVVTDDSRQAEAPQVIANRDRDRDRGALQLIRHGILRPIAPRPPRAAARPPAPSAVA